MLVYRFMQRFLGFLAEVFFRQIEVVGDEHVPAEGTATIFAGNHPNSLLDPVLIIARGGRIVHFAAKDVLFQSRVLRFFLDRLGAVPVARRADHPDGRLENDDAFDRMFGVLAAGRAVGIFPEGLSHDAAHLSRLKTGAARIALGAAERHPGLVVRVVPTGLTYVRRRRFRSRVLIQFGPAITVGADEVEAFRTDSQAASRALTERLEASLRDLTVNAEDWDTLRVLDGVRRLYQPADVSLEHRTELARRFNAVYPSVAQQPEIVALYTRVQAYLERLRADGLSDRDLRREPAPGETLARVSRHLVLMLVWMPLALPGFVFHLPLALAIGFAGLHLSPRKDVIATTKFVLGLLLMLAAFGAVVLGIGLFAGPAWALAAAGLLPLSGYATLRVVERGALMFRATGTLGRLLSLRRELADLRAERAALEQAVLGAVGRFRPASMTPIFPDRAGPGASTESPP